jgi:hypothetical protein
VPDLVTAFPQPADDLGEVGRLDDRHRRDHRAGVPVKDQVQHFVHALPPGRQILEVAAERRRRHPVQSEADVFGVADDTAGKPSLDLVRGLRLASAEGTVDPQEHGPTLRPDPEPAGCLAAAAARTDQNGPGRGPLRAGSMASPPRQAASAARRA